MGHQPGQHVDVRLTAEDGYQAERSYSIASPPEEAPHLTLTVERLDDGEVSPYLTDELHVGDKLELRGPIGGYFVWEAQMGGPLLLVAGGSGIVPLMAMLRHRAAVGSSVATRLLYSSRTYDDIIYRDELDRLVKSSTMLEVVQTLTHFRRMPALVCTRRSSRLQWRMSCAKVIPDPTGLAIFSDQLWVALAAAWPLESTDWLAA